ncbi:MAG: M20 family metallo-hydrolase [Thermoproteales archaeon]|nr:M20 family metallo-hydrolase [Thermoproteales archaeon]
MRRKILSEIFQRISGEEKFVTEVLSETIKRNSVNPTFGGPGEYERSTYIEGILKDFSPDVLKRIEVEDERVPEGVRVNILAFFKGMSDKTLWIIAHTDEVPEGDLNLWKTDPFKPVVKEGKVFGRGAEDNGHAIASMLLLAKIVNDIGVKPRLNIGLIFAADEEAGSNYGLKFILEKEKPFKKGDLILVPDAGSPKGDFIEIAEKSILWLKITTVGKQTHASTPHKGVNAHRIGMKLALLMDEVLHSRFSLRDPLFDPAESTFEPTRKEENVGNINTIPGTDVIYFDCRILPQYNVDQVVEVVERTTKFVEETFKVKVRVEVVARSDAAPPTDPNSEVVIKLKEALEFARGIKARVGGIGGGTFAAYVRRMGFPAAVWSTVDGTAHQPNEYTKISNVIEDAKVFATLVYS